MPEHVRAKNLGLVRPTPVLETPMHGRLQIEKRLSGGLGFLIICRCKHCGERIDSGVELSPKQSTTVGYKILYALGHPPIVAPPGFESEE